LKLPVKLAESDANPPTIMVTDESVVEIAGAAFATANGSQADEAALLLESPL